MPHIIDTTTEPFIPDGLMLAEHKKNGQFVWDEGKIKLYEANYRVAIPEDKRGDETFRDALSAIMSEGTTGFDVDEGLEDEHPLNANILNYLIEHQDLIPDSWKVDEKGTVRRIYFLGTIYNKRDTNGDNFCACFLYWNKTYWDWSYKFLYYVWDEAEVAVITK